MQMILANKLGALGAVIDGRIDRALDGLSPSAGALLSMLHFRPRLTTSAMAAVVGVSQPAAVRLIDGLERQGLVSRGAPDGRVTPLALTDAGQARAARLQRDRLSALDDLLSVLPAADRARFEASLDRILAGATRSRAWARTTCRLCEHDLCAGALCPIARRATDIEERETVR